MTLLSSDTPPEMEAILIDGYRRMSPAKKLARVHALNRAVQQLAVARIWERHPDATDREVQLRLASLWLDQETMMLMFGWDPVREGYWDGVVRAHPGDARGRRGLTDRGRRERVHANTNHTKRKLPTIRQACIAECPRTRPQILPPGKIRPSTRSHH